MRLKTQLEEEFFVPSNGHQKCLDKSLLVWTPKLGKPGKKIFLKVNTDISCKYFSFLAYQRSIKLLYETLDTLIEPLTAFTVRQF